MKFTRTHLFAWRQQYGLTQTQAADHLGVSLHTVLRWENGHTGIPPFLGLAIEEVSRRLEKPERIGPDIARETLSKTLYKTMEKLDPSHEAPEYEELSVEQKRFYRKLIAAIAEQRDMLEVYLAR